ncbi:MAG: CPBP family intramembrane metalloprotease [Bacteroidales bacterium]|nr:CPBP family intramembrane metalloprotease [Bacteroidales bacterium]
MSIKMMPVWKWCLLLLASLVLCFLMYGFHQMLVEQTVAVWLRCLVTTASSVAMLVLYALFVRWFERHPAQDLPFPKLAADTGKGFLIGILYFVVVAGVMWLCGIYKVTGTGTDQPELVISAFFLFFGVGVAEEIMFRGVLFRWIDEKWGFPIALAVSALLFGIMHLGQPNATWWSSAAIAIEAGLLLGAAYKWSGTLWLPIGIHWAWNFCQGNVFGFPVSGSDAGVSLIQSAVEGPELLTGGLFGAEASIFSVILGLLLSLWFILKIVKHS